jgi:hypothetical protein
VAEKYGEKGLRALRAMGTDFARTLQREIVERRDLQVLIDRRDALRAQLKAVEDKIDAAQKDLPDEPGLPRLETVIEALPDIAAKGGEGA